MTRAIHGGILVWVGYGMGRNIQEWKRVKKQAVLYLLQRCQKQVLGRADQFFRLLSLFWTVLAASNVLDRLGSSYFF